jgi:hypothetical protein
MAVSSADFIRMVRFQPTPQGGEPHGSWRGDVAVGGDGSGGDATLELTTSRGLLLVMFGWYVKNPSAVEYNVELVKDETGQELSLVRRPMTPIYNGEDGVYENCYVVIQSPSDGFTFLKGTRGNSSGGSFTMGAHGVYWEPSLLRQLNITPVLRG